MKITGKYRLGLLTLLVKLSFLLSAAQSQPNIILVISDDAGFADFGLQSTYTGTANEVPTDNLDALAAGGVLFTNAYTASVCSPSRAAIVTGSYQQRIGYEFNINNLTDPNGPLEGIPSETTTSTWNNETLLVNPITDPAVVGKNLGIRILSNGAGGEFVSIDDFYLSTGTTGTTKYISQLVSRQRLDRSRHNP